MSMSDADIEAARDVIAAASKGPATWTAAPNETEEEALSRFKRAFDGGRALTGSNALHAVEVDRRDDGSCCVMAITGNGPLAPANAAYIASSFDPVVGWAAALDEIKRLRALLRDVVHSKGVA